MKTKVAIFGAGEIGKAVYEIIASLRGSYQYGVYSPFDNISAFVIDSRSDKLEAMEDKNLHCLLNIQEDSSESIYEVLVNQQATHVINCLPFFLNEKVATAARMAGCAYIDFTEDDVMADRVSTIYQYSGLTCAVKCGLAPGFINYIGHDLVSKIHEPHTLMISVGALPRTVSYDECRPALSYNLTWSVDGLVNEYIRPSRIRQNGEIKEVPSLGKLTKVVLDGCEYEAALTSGGVGSLVSELGNVPNVQYMTLRYPGHYQYVKDVVQAHHGNFDKIKDVFVKTFPYTRDDVIVVYANAIGRNSDGMPVRQSYSNKFYGVGGLTGIQTTTAGSGVAILELILSNKISGMISHKDVSLKTFSDTFTFKKTYQS